MTIKKFKIHSQLSFNYILIRNTVRKNPTKFTLKGSEFMQEELKKALREVLKRKDIRNYELADSMHTTATNVSNWLSDTRPIPDHVLLELPTVINDFWFGVQWSCLLFKIDLITDNPYSRQALAQQVRANNEELDRKALEAKAEGIRSKQRSSWTDEDIEFMKKYHKEKQEEIQAEIQSFAADEQEVMA